MMLSARQRPKSFHLKQWALKIGPTRPYDDTAARERCVEAISCFVHTNDKANVFARCPGRQSFQSHWCPHSLLNTWKDYWVPEYQRLKCIGESRLAADICSQNILKDVLSIMQALFKSPGIIDGVDIRSGAACIKLTHIWSFSRKQRREVQTRPRGRRYQRSWTASPDTVHGDQERKLGTHHTGNPIPASPCRPLNGINAPKQSAVIHPRAEWPTESTASRVEADMLSLDNIALIQDTQDRALEV